jgi:plastocyanin domain-containing protein
VAAPAAPVPASTSAPVAMTTAGDGTFNFICGMNWTLPKVGKLMVN